MTLIISEGIRKVKGGYIVQLRWPYGPDPSGCGEVVCTTWDEVIKVLSEAAQPEEKK